MEDEKSEDMQRITVSLPLCGLRTGFCFYLESCWQFPSVACSPQDSDFKSQEIKSSNLYSVKWQDCLTFKEEGEDITQCLFLLIAGSWSFHISLRMLKIPRPFAGNKAWINPGNLDKCVSATIAIKQERTALSLFMSKGLHERFISKSKKTVMLCPVGEIKLGTRCSNSKLVPQRGFIAMTWQNEKPAFFIWRTLWSGVTQGFH